MFNFSLQQTGYEGKWRRWTISIINYLKAPLTPSNLDKQLNLTWETNAINFLKLRFVLIVRGHPFQYLPFEIRLIRLMKQAYCNTNEDFIEVNMFDNPVWFKDVLPCWLVPPLTRLCSPAAIWRPARHLLPTESIIRGICSQQWFIGGAWGGSLADCLVCGCNQRGHFSCHFGCFLSTPGGLGSSTQFYAREKAR